MSDPTQSGHVECRPQRSTSTFDASGTVMCATLIVHRSDSDEGRDLLPVKLSELWEFGNESGCSDGADPGDCLQTFVAFTPVVIGFDELQNGVIDAFEIFVQSINHRLETVADILLGRDGLAIEFAGPEFDELPSAGDQFIELALLLMGFSDWSRFDMLGKSSDDLSVQAVGLGQESDTFGIVTDVPGIDDGDGMPGSDQIADESVFIAPSGFDDDQTRTWSGQFLEQFRAGVASVSATEGSSLKDLDIEVILRDIDANERLNLGHVERLPALRMRARHARRLTALAAVRARFNRPATITLSHGLGRPRGRRSVTGRLGATRIATLCRLSQAVFHMIE